MVSSAIAFALLCNMAIPVHEFLAEAPGSPPDERVRLLKRLTESFESESRVREEHKPDAEELKLQLVRRLVCAGLMVVALLGPLQPVPPVAPAPARYPNGYAAQACVFADARRAEADLLQSGAAAIFVAHTAAIIDCLAKRMANSDSGRLALYAGAVPLLLTVGGGVES